MGSIYLRGKTYWLKYYHNGKPIRESAQTDKKTVAKRLLEQREGEISQGKIPRVYFDKVTFDELAEDMRTDYKVNGKKSLVRAERSVNHLKRHFGGRKANQISTPAINRYIQMRLEEEAANASINRELAALKRMLNMGAKATPPKVDRVPHIPMLRENNVRKGFFEHNEFLAFRKQLPDHLKGFVTFAYKTGWRVSEITNLTWNQVDLKQGIARLESGETKNDEGRTVYFDTELKALIENQWNRRKESKNLLPYVFLNREGTGRIKDFRDTWKTACTNSKIGAKTLHDFRRTAVRNMTRAGVPERVAMMVSGHKTRSVFERYNIVNDGDLRLAAKRQEAYLESQMGTNTGTIHHLNPGEQKEKDSPKHG